MIVYKVKHAPKPCYMAQTRSTTGVKDVSDDWVVCALIDHDRWSIRGQHLWTDKKFWEK